MPCDQRDAELQTLVFPLEVAFGHNQRVRQSKALLFGKVMVCVTLHPLSGDNNAMKEFIVKHQKRILGTLSGFDPNLPRRSFLVRPRERELDGR